MSELVERMVRMHRVAQQRVVTWERELEQRRREVASRACIDLASLRSRLAI